MEVESPYKGRSGIARLLSATRNSLHGLLAAIRHEHAFRQELALSLALVPLGIWLGKTGIERALLVGAVLIVLIVELVNSAVESAVDRVSLEHHALAKRAKDLGSAAVMLALAMAGAVWLLVLVS